VRLWSSQFGDFIKDCGQDKMNGFEKKTNFYQNYAKLKGVVNSSSKYEKSIKCTQVILYVHLNTYTEILQVMTSLKNPY
jgi:hypothetical protein